MFTEAEIISTMPAEMTLSDLLRDGEDGPFRLEIVAQFLEMAAQALRAGLRWAPIEIRAADNTLIARTTFKLDEADLAIVGRLIEDIRAGRNPEPTIPTKPKGQFADRDSLTTFSGKQDQALFRALLSRNEWQVSPEDYPYYKDRELKNFKISIAGEPGREGISPARAAELKPVFENIVDPKTVILYAACMDLWNRARTSGRNLTDLQAVRIHVDDLCELFGYKRHPNGAYQYVHKKEISKRLQDLRSLEGHGDYMDEKGRQRRLRGAYAHVTFDDFVPLLGDPEPYEFIVRPGDAVYKMVEANPALMRVYKSLAPLTTSRPNVKGSGLKQEFALKIGVYLCRIFRIRQVTQSFSDPISIQTIIEKSCIAADATKAALPKHYTRFREQIDEAFDLLRGKVIASWEYAAGDEERLPDRAWFKPWLQNRVTFTPLPDVIEAGEQRSAEQRQVISAAKRRRQAS